MASSETNFELAHILFMDLKMLINDQREVMRDLNAIVRGTEQFRAAEAEEVNLFADWRWNGAGVFYRSRRRGLLRYRDPSDAAPTPCD